MKVKKKPLEFPKYMTIPERTKWRKIHKYLVDGKDSLVSKKDQEFHKRYKLDIKNLDN